MYLYNISLIVEDSQHNTFIDWLKNEWLINSDKKIKLLKMINSPHEGHTYCLQITVDTEEEVNLFQQKHLNDLQNHIGTHYKEKAFVFDSLMQYQ